MIRFDILTLFPEMIEGFFNTSILKRAIDKKLIEINIINFRDYATNARHSVDDYEFGGGAGMLISVEPIHKALEAIDGLKNSYKILTSPAGTVWNEAVAKRISKMDHIVLICGHYEGFDARVLNYVDEEVSIGDFVLTGGELPACIIVDSVARLIEGVIASDSLQQESFQEGLLEYPQYTHPKVYDGKNVPEILFTGHHANIRKWRLKEALRKTYIKRPDLLKARNFTKEELKLMEEIKNEEDHTS
jgi:tRNA (guanine37-N1)-methyltransferase